MGGDNAPAAIVEGTLLAADRHSDVIEPILVGDEPVLRAELARQGAGGRGIRIVHAEQQIDMGEAGADAFRKKRDSSLSVATRLVRDGEADGLFSAGNTGAMVAASLLTIGRLKGVNRPALATPIPSSGEHAWAIVLDVGASAEVKPINLYQYGILGDAYFRILFNTPHPKVGLLNIGEETSKGSDSAREAHKLLADSHLNFVGNVEGADILWGGVDVVVTDGFTGNVMLKFAESIWSWTTGLARKEVGDHLLAKLGMLLLRPSLHRVKTRMDYSEYGGAPLLGVDGIAMVGHGRSNPKAVCNAIRFTGELHRKGLNQEISRDLQREQGGKVVGS